MPKSAQHLAASGNGSSVPKYAIRIGLIWAIPVFSVLFRCASWGPFLMGVVLTPVEVPKLRKRVFGKAAQKQLPCFKVPAIMRLLVLWMCQAWWIILWREAADSAPDAVGASGPPIEEPLDPALAWNPQTFSVVLPCAGEGEFALNTVRAVFDTTPTDILKEIIVVDDGSEPALSETFLGEQIRQQYGVRIIRHANTIGLIGAKKDGGDSASGDIVVFFDCHVAPQVGWHTSFLRLIGENYRRIVVPVITDLDVGTWQQRGGRGGQAKCYLTWDADFKWFNSDDPYVPVLSGGLLGISKRWWKETGGYDEVMRGWGGENLDQSLRSWLCGGEIVIAKDSFVAHMWRVPGDPRTRAKYIVNADSAEKNRMRAAVAWFGEFAEKLGQFPNMRSDLKDAKGLPWYGDLENILSVKRNLRCKSFAWFMHRFNNVYEDGGLIPAETFGLRTGEHLCLSYEGAAGTSPDGLGTAVLQPCNPNDDRQRWHGANRDTATAGQPCCSGLRAWNTDQCLAGISAAGTAKTFVCDISGHTSDQGWKMTESGQIRAAVGGFMSARCLAPSGDGISLQVQSCPRAGIATWSKDAPALPIETRLYQQARETGWSSE